MFSAYPVVRDALSAVIPIGDTLWLANDETTHLERLILQGEDCDGNPQYGDHTHIDLHAYLQLPIAAGEKNSEIDVEGLDYHDGYLWLVGSHSLKRKQPPQGESVDKAIRKLAKLERDANRYLLARIPVAVEEGIATLQAPAAQLPIHHKTGNPLLAALHDDPHLGDFLAIPGKDNGFDIEGLAVVGQRLFLGLRGPVLRGWAVILEVEVAEGDDPSTLQLANIGADERPYRKHFLQLGGLGVRDLCVQGDDLLILAGPTMSLDGPVTVHRWQGGAIPEGESLVAAEHLPVVLDVPYGQGDDHAEGMCLFQRGDGGTALLVVYDSAASHRKQGKTTVSADLFPLDAD
jgi:hypothetical protein